MRCLQREAESFRQEPKGKLLLFLVKIVGYIQTPTRRTSHESQ